MVPSGRQHTGPRAMERTQQRRETAQTLMQKHRKENLRKQDDSPNETPESTATAANICAAKGMFKPSALDVSSEGGLKTMVDDPTKREEAVTYWSHEMIATNPIFPSRL